MVDEPGLPGNTGSNTHSIARNLISGQATTRGNVERVHDETQRTFVSSDDFGLNADDNHAFRIENPASSSRAAYFYHGEVSHRDDCAVTLHTEVENVGGSDTETPHNNYIGSEIESVLDVNVIDSFDSLDTHFTQTYVGSGTQTIFDGYRITLPPSESIVLDIQNIGNEWDAGFGTRFAWAESEQLTE